MVPLSSVVTQDGYTYVFVVNEQQLVVRRRVETGAVHVARVGQVAAGRSDRDELSQDLALRFALANRLGCLLRAGDIAATQFDCGDLHERGALLPLRFDAIGCLARSRQIFSGNLREHDVVQHPVAERRLANLLDRCQSQVDRAIGGSLADECLHARNAGERFGASIRIFDGVGHRERTRQRDAAPLLRIFERLSVRESDRCRERRRNQQNAPKLHAWVGRRKAAAHIDDVDRDGGIHDSIADPGHRIGIGRGAHRLASDVKADAHRVGGLPR